MSCDSHRVGGRCSVLSITHKLSAKNLNASASVRIFAGASEAEQVLGGTGRWPVVSGGSPETLSPGASGNVAGSRPGLATPQEEMPASTGERPAEQSLDRSVLTDTFATEQCQGLFMESRHAQTRCAAQ